MKDSIINAVEEAEENDGLLELKEEKRYFFDNTVKVLQERYEELIKAEATLEILGRVIKQTHPYEIKTYRAIAEKYIPADEGDDEK